MARSTSAGSRAWTKVGAGNVYSSRLAATIRSHAATPVDAAYKERKLVDGRGPSAPSSRTMPCGARKACLCCHAGLSREQVKQAVGLVQAAQALLISAPPGCSAPNSISVSSKKTE